MASSRNFDSLGLRCAPGKAPGPFCVASAPATRDTPGSLGIGDWSEFLTNANACPAPNFAPIVCACHRDITLDELCWIYSHAKRKTCETYLPLLNKTFTNYEIDTCLRKAHFLAQVAHESGELHYTAEVLQKGHTEAKDYGGYKGRGLIQLTHKQNYTAYGTAVHHDFLGDHRTDLEQPAWATDSAGWYWTSGVKGHDLNKLADKNDLLAITAFINGAFNGFTERRNYLAVAFDALKVKFCYTVNVGNDPYRKFKDSECYQSQLQSFAWGAWNDMTTHKKGVNPKDARERKAGYARYLELKAEAQRKHLARPSNKRHFGYTEAQMDAMAQKGAK